MRLYLLLALAIVVSLSTSPVVSAQSDGANDPLVRVLEAKGVLSSAEARAITANASTAELRDRLAILLRDKGVISSLPRSLRFDLSNILQLLEV